MERTSLSAPRAQQKKRHIRWLLVGYDLCLYLVMIFLLFVLHPSLQYPLPARDLYYHAALGFVCLFGMRFLLRVYEQIWRYGDMVPYLRLLAADFCGGILLAVLERLLPVNGVSIIRLGGLVCCDLIGAFAMRMAYHCFYLYASHRETWLRGPVRFMTGVDIAPDVEKPGRSRIRLAIVGAGQVGAGLAEELISNPGAAYIPVCFIDNDMEKAGRAIQSLPVIHDTWVTEAELQRYGVQEIVLAIPAMSGDEKKSLYETYQATGRPVKIYDYPTISPAGSERRQLREFKIEELLFRQPITLENDDTAAYYKNKTLLITGGGGSIGSELCRQAARMEPRRLVILDVYENGAYEVQQELKMLYPQLDVCIEIVSVCDAVGLQRVFETHRPDVVLHAAAHKHVPLMERNCVEAVNNNVFGTRNVTRLAEQYGVGRFILISTDKAVNPTNVMGATKRMCELLVLSRSRTSTTTVYSATRFGNVLGSAGSVIPLFQKQIARGGPVTITDKRIIRYFMTIPEASQLVLQSGAMAKNGELFVLDMGKPVKILELAQNMIRLSGYEEGRDIQIVETGLRPGEKLYEELLIKTETLEKTENQLIFIERDEPLEWTQVEEKLNQLEQAVASGSDQAVREALMQVVPTFHSAEEVNARAEERLSQAV